MDMDIKDVEIARRILAGEPQRSIAKDFGVCHQAINQRANKPAVRAFIEAEQQALIDSHLTKARSNLQFLIDTLPDRFLRQVVWQSPGERKGRPFKRLLDPEGNEVDPDADRQAASLGYGASVRVLQSVGILPAPAPSILIQRIYNQTNLTLAPVLVQVLQQVINSQTNEDGMGDDNLESMPSD